MAQELKVVYLPLDQISEYAGNAKIHDERNVKAIKASIERFGNCDPIGVWTNPAGEYEIVEGHGRRQALMELGHAEAPCIFLDHLTDEERRAYALAHNQTTLMTGFDMTVLADELDGLGDFHMEDFGFEQVPEVDIDSFFADVPETEPEPDEPKEVQCPHCKLWFEVE